MLTVCALGQRYVSKQIMLLTTYLSLCQKIRRKTYLECVLQKGLYLHEIGHALGLVHEHQLPDRDQHIDIVWDNVKPEWRRWFNKYSGSEIEQDSLPYDLTSVMHYGITVSARMLCGLISARTRCVTGMLIAYASCFPISQLRLNLV